MYSRIGRDGLTGEGSAGADAILIPGDVRWKVLLLVRVRAARRD